MGITAAARPRTFDDFFRTEYPRLVAVASALIGEHEAARDLAQEALLRCHREWARVGSLDVPEAWVRRASAFPETNTLPDLWQLVSWSPTGHAFVGAQHWDEWGRALNAGRQHDLAGFSAELDGDRVMVRTNGLDRVPGSPVVTPGGAEQVRPSLPPMIGLDEIDGAGWVQVAETLVLHDGVARLCIVDPNVRFDLMQPCPDSAPDLPEIEFASARCATTWYFGPTLLHADASGDVTELITMGGSSGRLDSVIPGDCTPPTTV